MINDVVVDASRDRSITKKYCMDVTNAGATMSQSFPN